MKINEALKANKLIASRYEKNGKASIVDTNLGRYVYKETSINSEILDYLKSRNFDYLPNIINKKDYQLAQYIEEFEIPKEQKILDLVTLVALLHSKTTHYKEVDPEAYEQIYEDLNNNIEYLYGYYTDIINIIETKVYMSPSEYLLARNISVIYKTLSENKEKLEKWHKQTLEKRKMRSVVLHNNLELNHFLRNGNSYLISWDKAKIGSPVFDLYKLYRKHALDFDFTEIFSVYEKNYPLTEDERNLLYILISLPNILEFNDTEYNTCMKISREIDIIYKTRNLTKTT